MYPIHRLFTKTCFTVGYRYTESDIRQDKNTKFKTLKIDNNFWYADPIPFKYKGQIYIFMEVFDVKKGYAGIGFSKIAGGELTEPQIIIDEGFHMSFPCIFERGGKIFMLPETIAERNLQVYECLDFPDKWKKAYQLAENVVCYDTAVFYSDRNYYAFTSEPTGDIYGSKLFLLKLSGEEDLHIEQKTEITGNYEISRQAGNILVLNNTVYRVAQDCNKLQYGRALVFNKIEKLDINNYREVQIEKIGPSDVSVQKKWFWELAGMHSYGKIDNFEVVDFKICIFSLSTVAVKIGLSFEYLFGRIRKKFRNVK